MFATYGLGNLDLTMLDFHVHTQREIGTSEPCNLRHCPMTQQLVWLFHFLPLGVSRKASLLLFRDDGDDHRVDDSLIILTYFIIVDISSTK